MKIRFRFLLAAFLAILPCSIAQAGVFIGVGVPVYRPYYHRPRVIVVAPVAPVVVATPVVPVPVYVVPAPQPVIVQPVPVITPAPGAGALPAQPIPVYSSPAANTPREVVPNP
jgi:hypothetical protein